MSGPGIDYSMGKSNFDPKTGIHFGVIAQGSLLPEAADDIWTEGSVYLPYCPHCHEANDREQEDAGECCVCAEKVGVDDWEYAEEPSFIEYTTECDEGPIVIIDCLSTDYMIIKSPFYTYTKFCSPCVPGAGDLDSPVEDGVITYCLPDEFFEENAPYDVFKVEDRPK